MEKTIVTRSSSVLGEIATELLRRNGLTWAGRPKGAVDSGQYRFEKRMVRVPMGGAPKKSKP